MGLPRSRDRPASSVWRIAGVSRSSIGRGSTARLRFFVATAGVDRSPPIIRRPPESLSHDGSATRARRSPARRVAPTTRQAMVSDRSSRLPPGESVVRRVTAGKPRGRGAIGVPCATRTPRHSAWRGSHGSACGATRRRCRDCLQLPCGAAAASHDERRVGRLPQRGSGSSRDLHRAAGARGGERLTDSSSS